MNNTIVLKKDLGETPARVGISMSNTINTKPTKATLENVIKAVLTEKNAKMGDGSGYIGNIT